MSSGPYTDLHETMRDSIAKFVKRDLDPYAEQWEREGTLPMHDILRKAGSLGLLGLDKPARFGGQELDFSFVALAAEELGKTQATAVPFAIGAHISATPALARHGSDSLRSEFLAPAINGEMVACIGVSEPQAGSDVARMTTRARKDGGDWVISGNKMWITNSPRGDWISVLANTSDEGAPYKNKSLIVVPFKTKGVSVGSPLEKVGMRSSDTAPVFFDEVRVPLRHLVGEEGRGFIYQMEQFQHERMWATLRTISGLDEALRITIEYTSSRKAFGKSILDNQVVYHRIADYRAQLEALRALCYRTVSDMVDGRDATTSVSMCKYLVGKLALELPSACAQYFGGQGFMWEARISQLMRDLRVVAFGAGANEIMLEIIAKRTVLNGGSGK